MTTEQKLIIKAPKFDGVIFELVGTSPLVQNRFWKKTQLQELYGTASRASGKNKKARDYDYEFDQSMHYSTDGWIGVPASAFRNAFISACRIVNFKMTLAKLSIFVDGDGFDRDDGIPLVKLNGKPEKIIHSTRIQKSTGIASRAMFRDWSIELKVRYDADIYSSQDIGNLLQRVGCQVGIGEGRPDSKSGSGMGWGLFEIK